MGQNGQESKSAAGIAERLAVLFSAGKKEPVSIQNLARLSGGATQESWRFDAAGAPLLLRRISSGRAEDGMPAETEARLVAVLFEAGLPVPRIVSVLKPEDGLGEGFLMTRYEGETIARKILRDSAYAAIRPHLAGQCGEILARIHAVEPKNLPELPLMHATGQLEHYRLIYTALGGADPLFLHAFHWLEKHCPAKTTPHLVHGDYRNGNLMIIPEGVSRVLDWELAHFGDPAEDLSWFCLPSWRFGEIDKPAGGFGPREAFLDAYEKVGGVRPDPARQKFWDVLSALKWGVMCAMIAAREDGGIEQKVIGRRVSESELNLLVLLAPEDGPESVREHLAAMPRPAPSPAGPILDETEAFLRRIAGQLHDRQRFHAAVAANGLAIAKREAELGRMLQEEEARRLAAITGENHLAAARKALGRALTAGAIDMTRELARHFWRTTLARLAIDQPSYALYRHLCAKAQGRQSGGR